MERWQILCVIGAVTGATVGAEAAELIAEMHGPCVIQQYVCVTDPTAPIHVPAHFGSGASSS